MSIDPVEKSGLQKSRLDDMRWFLKIWASGSFHRFGQRHSGFKLDIKEGLLLAPRKNDNVAVQIGYVLWLRFDLKDIHFQPGKWGSDNRQNPYSITDREARHVVLPQGFEIAFSYVANPVGSIAPRDLS